MSTPYGHSQSGREAMPSNIESSRKRSRSRSPAYDGGHPASRERIEHKRARSRDQYERDGWQSPSRNHSQRRWEDLTAEEQDREWVRWDRENRSDRDRHTRSAMEPMDSLSLLTFRRYTQLLRESGTEPAALASGVEATQVLYSKYMDYRKAFYKRAMRQTWQTHKNEKWFVEKYGVDNASQESRRQRKRLGRLGKKANWLAELRSGELDKVCWDVTADEAAGPARLQGVDRHGMMEVLDEDSFTIEAKPNQLLVKSIPIEIGREDLEEILSGEEGFQYLALGEPHPLKRFSRIGWAVFDEDKTASLQDVAAELSQRSICGQSLSFETITRPAQVKLRLAPEVACGKLRLLHDAKQARKLVRMLEEDDRKILFKDDEGLTEQHVDASVEIVDRVLSIAPAETNEEAKGALKMHLGLIEEASEREEDKKETPDSVLVRLTLDLHIDLLRQVYHCDYYSSTLCDFPEELLRRAPRCGRRVTIRNGGAITDGEERSNDRARIWTSNVDEKTQLLLCPDDNEIGQFGGVDLQQMLLDSAAPYSRQDEEEKHRCVVKLDGENECGKPFKAQIFVQKHVLNKHRDWFSAKMADDIAETRSYNNYVRDPQRPMPSLQADRMEHNGNGHTTDGHGPPTDGHGQPFGSSGGGYYGVGGVLRIGATQPAGLQNYGNGTGNLRDRIDSRGGGSSRMGSASAALQRAPLPQNPRPLDPRANMAPKSYQDLDAGAPTQDADLELQY